MGMGMIWHGQETEKKNAKPTVSQEQVVHGKKAPRIVFSGEKGAGTLF